MTIRAEANQYYRERADRENYHFCHYNYHAPLTNYQNAALYYQRLAAEDCDVRNWMGTIMSWLERPLWDHEDDFAMAAEEIDRMRREAR